MDCAGILSRALAVPSKEPCFWANTPKGNNNKNKIYFFIPRTKIIIKDDFR
jgi:hypothetical protein